MEDHLIKQYLNDKCIFACHPLSKPILASLHITQRPYLARNWLYLKGKEIKSIVFNDESKFNLKYKDGRPLMWRTRSSELEPENIDHTVKFGKGSVKVCGCISYQGVGRLVFIEEKWMLVLH